MKPKQVVCYECDRKRDLYKFVIQLRDGTKVQCCRQCWKRLDYDQFMGPSSPK
jgi:hypothetical protein